MDFDSIVKDLDEFINDHEISKAILVGHSMGGKTAIVYALTKVIMCGFFSVFKHLKVSSFVELI